MPEFVRERRAQSGLTPWVERERGGDAYLWRTIRKERRDPLYLDGAAREGREVGIEVKVTGVLLQQPGEIVCCDRIGHHAVPGAQEPRDALVTELVQVHLLIIRPPAVPAGLIGHPPH